MTDNEIIKALECSPLNDIGGCRKIDALDLINRQKAEIEALINGQENLKKYIAEQKAEIERLKQQPLYDFYKEKSEAIKEFAEKLKDYHKNYEGFCVVDDDDIDNLVAAMTEGREDV